MTEGTAISALQSALNQSRDARRKIEARIAEIEAELKALHAQHISIVSVIEQTESALRRALFPSDTPVERYQAESYQPSRPPADLEISAPPQRHVQTSQPQYQPPREERYAQPNYQSGHQPPQYQTAHDQASQYQMAQIEEQVAKVRRSEQSSNVRFNDFRIPQAATIVLREASGPLHVNEIYRRMAEGGFEFRGQHQLITLAVSLTRSKRFRKVAPGTFELSPEFLAGQVA